MSQITGSLNSNGNITGALNPGGVGGAEELSELNDVEITNVQNAQVLRYTVSNSKWVNVSPDIAFPIWQESEVDITMDPVLGGQVIVTFSGDVTDKVLDLHFNYSMVCPNFISVDYSDLTDSTTIYLGVPYMAVNDMKVLISLRNKRS